MLYVKTCLFRVHALFSREIFLSSRSKNTDLQKFPFVPGYLDGDDDVQGRARGEDGEHDAAELEGRVLGQIL
jgi:hypothetical protein